MEPHGKCLKPGQLEGMEIKADLSQSALVISLPQAYLEYTWPDWDPPSRWDDGISGIIADYSITAQTRHEENGGDDSNEISGNGTVGVNLGPWRMRADWQTNYQHTRSNDDDEEFSGDDTQKKWEWSRYYAWRALPSLKAKLALGEDYLNSDIFDGFNYVGGSVSTDDQMLPPNLRGYAPDISGVAHTTAKVTVSQMGRVIYETQVPAGPFRIQDLGDSVSGTLHIRIEEQNGQVQEYDISTASMPYLTRPGQVRYKIMMGRPQEWGHHVEGEFFLVLKLPGGSLMVGRSMVARWGMKTTNLPHLALVAICLRSARSRLMLLTRTPNWIKTPLMAKVRWTVTPSV